MSDQFKVSESKEHSKQKTSDSVELGTSLNIAEIANEIKQASQTVSSESIVHLQKAEQSLQYLERTTSSKSFEESLENLNTLVNSPTNLEEQYLPFLRIAGTNSSGDILVHNPADSKLEHLRVVNGVIGPDADLDRTQTTSLWSTAGDVKATAVEQGRISDCYFLAALMTVAQHSPETIKNMIEETRDADTGQRLFKVTFPGDPSHPVTVSEPTIYETTAFNQNRDGLWACVLEKAHRAYTGLQLHDDGGNSEDALKLLTGRNATTIEMYDLSSESTGTATLADFMNKINSANELFTAETKYDAAPIKDSGGNLISLDPKHQYAVVSVDSVSQVVTLRNPHESNDVIGEFKPEIDNFYSPSKFDEMLDRINPKRQKTNQIGGLVRISMSDFAKNFESVTITPIE